MQIIVPSQNCQNFLERYIDKNGQNRPELSELSEFSREIYRYEWSELSRIVRIVRIVQNCPELSELSRERDIDQRMPDDANLLHQ